MKPRGGRSRLMAVHPVHGYAVPPPQDVKVGRRNARERNRVLHVNSGFEVLKRHVPAAAPIKKMSKVHILSHAVEYIQSLQALLHETPSSSGLSSPAMACGSQEKESHLISYPPQHDYSQSSRPPPLTPISPNVPFYHSPNYTYYPNYESGYETSGFYSDTDPPLPNTSWRPVHYIPQGPHQRCLTEENTSWPVQDERRFKQEGSIHEAESISTSPSLISESSSAHYSPPVRPAIVKPDPESRSARYSLPVEAAARIKPDPESSTARYRLPIPAAARIKQDTESSGEEDDILDAIEEWQRA